MTGESVQLGCSGISIPRLGFGCCPMGGHGWGSVNQDEMIDAVQVALDRGVNFFDTADVYGLGTSERILGQALGSRRQEAVIATKFGVRLDEQKRSRYDNSPEWIEQALHGSLRRLGTETIDLYQIHYRDNTIPLEEVFDALERHRTAGKIRCYGLSNPEGQDLLTAGEHLASYQMEYSLANRRNESAIRSAASNLTFISWGSLGQGALTGKYGSTVEFGSDDRRSRAVYANFHGARLTRNLEIVSVLREIGAKMQKEPAAVAIRWILDGIKGSVVLAGVKRRHQLLANAGALDWTLEPSDLAKLEEISRDVPASEEGLE